MQQTPSWLKMGTGEGATMTTRNYRSTFLFVSPSLSVLDGFARLLDLRGTLSAWNYSPSGEAADARALAADWHAIGNDICWAIRKNSERARGQKAEGPSPR